MNRRSLLTLTLPTLVILGVHLFAHPHTGIAHSGFHHQFAHHANHELFGANAHHLGFVHNHHANAHDFDRHFHHAAAGNSAGATTERGRWNNHSKWDDQARKDMIARIAHEGWSWTPQVDSFGKQSNWLPGWELRWWSFSRNDGGVAWVYHARSKASGQRYTSITSHVDGKLQIWKAVR